MIGLTSAEGKVRLESLGPNEVKSERGRRHLAILARFVSNPLVLILLIAAAVSFGVGDRINAGIIAGLILLSLTLDTVQNFRSRAAIKRLQAAVAPTASVLAGWNLGRDREAAARARRCGTDRGR
jgi:P-type Mg2+ transporter